MDISPTEANRGNNTNWCLSQREWSTMILVVPVEIRVLPSKTRRIPRIAFGHLQLDAKSYLLHTSFGAVLSLTRTMCTKFYVSTVRQNRTKVSNSGFPVRPFNHWPVLCQSERRFLAVEHGPNKQKTKQKVRK
jgi:hypothetical protein